MQTDRPLSLAWTMEKGTGWGVGVGAWGGGGWREGINCEEWDPRGTV